LNIYFNINKNQIPSGISRCGTQNTSVSSIH